MCGILHHTLLSVKASVYLTLRQLQYGALPKTPDKKRNVIVQFNDFKYIVGNIRRPFQREYGERPESCVGSTKDI
jgi:hypothetical protein